MWLCYWLLLLWCVWDLSFMMHYSSQLLRLFARADPARLIPLPAAQTYSEWQLEQQGVVPGGLFADC